MMNKENGLQEVGKSLWFFRERGVLQFPVIKVSGREWDVYMMPLGLVITRTRH